MNVLDLFSGIGGFSLGLERAGMRTVAFCEIDPYCRAVLRRHWPDVPVYDDVRTLTVHQGWLVPDADKRCEPAEKQLRAGRQGIRADSIDIICGGFPCQDISIAGQGAGITGERSGLWKEYARIIGEVRPRYAIIENVAALLSRGIGDVLFDLSALGYDAEWHCIPASAVGAPHRRDRVWIVAYPSGEGRPKGQCEPDAGSGQACRERTGQSGGVCPDVADAGSGRQSGSWQPVDAIDPAPRLIGQAIELGNGGVPNQWSVEPDVGRVANGVPARVDRLRALGNAVVPQIPELIGRAIMTASAALDEDGANDQQPLQIDGGGGG